MAEFALMIPILILLLFGMMFAAFYAFRSASADWGVFITGVATGSYDTPATEQARGAVLWPDLGNFVKRVLLPHSAIVKSPGLLPMLLLFASFRKQLGGLPTQRFTIGCSQARHIFTI